MNVQQHTRDPSYTSKSFFSCYLSLACVMDDVERDLNREGREAAPECLTPEKAVGPDGRREFEGWLKWNYGDA